MKLKEEQKFLDLDMVAERILHDGDRDMFREAIRCYHVGSHRAAVILVWMATAECLKRRLSELAHDNDPEAQQARRLINDKERNNQSYEQELIDHARKCELVNQYEKQCLEFVRDTRSQCAHPTGTIPTAEAVRHALQICSDYVLTRRGYRGQTYIENLVTTQFNDRHFLPENDEQGAKQRCRVILDNIPERLRPRITAIAAEKWPDAKGETWRNNARQFFKVLLENTEEEGAARAITRGFEGFEVQNPEFFAALLGLDQRVVHFWDEQKRNQARSRLVSVSAMQIRQENVEAWARICEVQGLHDEDRRLLEERLHILSRHLPASFVDIHYEDVFSILATLAEDDQLAERAASAIPTLFSLANRTSEGSNHVMQQIVQRFSTDEKYRNVLERAGDWRDALLAQFLEHTEAFLLECSEDNYEDILLLFKVAKELSTPMLLSMSDHFKLSIVKVLSGELQPEWNARDSQAGQTFKGATKDLLGDRPILFDGTSIADLLERYATAALEEHIGALQAVPEEEIAATQDWWNERLGKELTREQAATIYIVSEFGASTVEFLAEQIGMDREAANEVAFQLVKEGLLEQHDESLDLLPHLKVVEESTEH